MEHFAHDTKVRFKMSPRITGSPVGVRDLPFVVAETPDKWVQRVYWTLLTDNRIGLAFFNRGAMGSAREADGGFSLPFLYSGTYKWGPEFRWPSPERLSPLDALARPDLLYPGKGTADRQVLWLLQQQGPRAAAQATTKLDRHHTPADHFARDRAGRFRSPLETRLGSPHSQSLPRRPPHLPQMRRHAADHRLHRGSAGHREDPASPHALH